MIGFPVIQGDVLIINLIFGGFNLPKNFILAMLLNHTLNHFPDDRHILQTQQIHLDQTQILNLCHHHLCRQHLGAGVVGRVGCGHEV